VNVTDLAYDDLSIELALIRQRAEIARALIEFAGIQTDPNVKHALLSASRLVYTEKGTNRRVA
jgi:hypothetical protein